jgi:hypothetical protein
MHELGGECGECAALAVPAALPAIADALTRHAANWRLCKTLVAFLRIVRWEDCSDYAAVQRAADALLACLACDAPTTVYSDFMVDAAIALGCLLAGRHYGHWKIYLQCALEPLAAALRRAPCKIHANAAGALCLGQS